MNSKTTIALNLMLLVLSCLVAADGHRVSLSQKRDERYHPGHSPHHVTRLHRYEHEGIQSMLEQESMWTKGVQEMRRTSADKEFEESKDVHHIRSFRSGREFKDIHHIRGSSRFEDQEIAAERSDFVKISGVQTRALQAHHRSWMDAMLQTGDVKAEGKVANQSSEAAGRGALLQKFEVQLNAYRQRSLGDGVVATALRKLSSQYVGPIGVGTVLSPAGCVLKEEGALSQTNKEEGALSQTNKVANGINILPGEPDSLLEIACTIKDQSKIWVVFDTGSTNIWVKSDLCKSGACQVPGSHTFNHSASATFKYPSSMLQLSVQFGTGKITGPQAMDDFHMGPFSVYNQTFAMIETEQGMPADLLFEGIVGMAFDKMSANHVQPFFSSLIQQKALPHNEFAFYFSRDNPSANALFWGGVDNKFYEGDLQYFPVIDPYYWSLKLLNFKIGEHVILDSSNTYEGSALVEGGANPGSARTEGTRQWNGPVAVVDTGTTFFTAESGKFTEVLSKLPPAQCKDVTEQTHPPITITLENVRGEPHDFVMTHKQYMAENGMENAHCSPAFMQIDLPAEHGPGMVLGEVFLRHFFAVFDRDTGKNTDAKIAFAESSNKQDALTRLQELTGDQPVFGAGGDKDVQGKL